MALTSRFCHKSLQISPKLTSAVCRSLFTGLVSRRESQLTSKPSPHRKVPSHICLPPYVKRNAYDVPSQPDIKSVEEVDSMRPACTLAARILDCVEDNIQEGMTTDAIDALVHRLCVEKGAYPSPLLYKGFPKSVCTSVNHVACHGIPGPHVLQKGDIITVDVTVYFKGYHGDTSRTFCIGAVDESDLRLVETARLCRDIGIEVCQDGAKFTDIGEAIYYCASEAGFHIIPNFCGHGIGKYFHGPPDIIHVPIENAGPEEMKAGMVFTIEPIICQGSPEVRILEDGWTVETIDHSKSAQFEHTVLVTPEGCEILTQ